MVRRNSPISVLPFPIWWIMFLKEKYHLKSSNWLCLYIAIKIPFYNATDQRLYLVRTKCNRFLHYLDQAQKRKSQKRNWMRFRFQNCCLKRPERSTKNYCLKRSACSTKNCCLKRLERSTKNCCLKRPARSTKNYCLKRS